MIIYKLTNTVNNKIYIGQTIQSLDKRLLQHKKKHKTMSPVTLAILKYGFNNFKCEVLLEVDTQYHLDEWERIFIRINKSLTTQGGYNISLGGKGKGSWSDESRNKLSESLREYYKEHQTWNKGKETPLSVREKMSYVSKNNPKRICDLMQRNLARRGIKQSDETRNKKSVSLRKSYRDNPRPKKTGCSSKYTGVSYHKLTSKWNARLTINSERISLGYFNTENEAYQAIILYKEGSNNGF